MGKHVEPSVDLDSLVKGMSHEDMLRVLELMEELDKRKRVNICRQSLPAFVLHMQPDYKMGNHLKHLYRLLENVEKGEKDRILVNMGPRFGKSQAISIYFPAWYLGKHPDHKVIIASHTADLAVDMLRKVRNLMQTDEYKAIFPGVDIAADAKAAGKWNTTKGGEAYAVGVGGALAGRGGHLCVHPESLVTVQRKGSVQAQDVEVGDFILSHKGFLPVVKKFDSEHTSTVKLNKVLRTTQEHPHWVFGKGFVPANEIEVGDVLWTTCLYDKVKALLTGASNAKDDTQQIIQPNIQHLGDDAPAMQQPKCSKLRRLWGQGYKGLRTLGYFFKLLGRHGGITFPAAYAGSNRWYKGVRPGELPLGGPGNAAQQQTIVCVLRARWAKAYRTAVGAKKRDKCRHVQTPRERAWHEYCRSIGGPKDVPCPEAGYPEVFGWLRNSSARLIGRRGKKTFFGLRTRKESYLAMFSEKIEDLFGLLLGVRRVTHVVYVQKHTPRPFVNFMVGGDNTFIVDNVLTHNCIVDDPFSEQDVINGNYEVFEKVYQWYTTGLRPRLQPGGAIATLHTRWSLRDLTARLMKDAALNPEADQYELFEFPAILNEGTDNEKSLWPDQWSLESLKRTKASMPLFQWNAQYQQNPTNSDSGIVVKEWFMQWEKQRPPKVEYIIMSLDAAVEAKKRSDFNALITAGVFFNEETNRNEIILLNSLNFRAEFPELKDKARQEYAYWEPDTFIIEQRANGAPLIQEFRNAGVYIQPYMPHRGTGDKIARLNSVADIIRDGALWVPQTRWAEEVVDQVCAMPGGDHDDLCFVKNTEVSLYGGGKKCIVELQPGDKVVTPTGVDEVVYCVQTNPNAQTYTAYFEDGTTLTGTGNHPIYVASENAFVPLAQLEQGSFLCKQSKYVSTEVLRTVDTLKVKALHYDDTSTAEEKVKMKHSIAGFGRTTTALYQKAIRYITKTKILVTIPQTIWSAYLFKSIGSTIECRTTSLQLSSFVKETGHARSVIHGLRNSPLRLFANIKDAANLSFRIKLTGLDFAQGTAGMSTTQADQNQRYVSSAEQSLKPQTVLPRVPQHAKKKGIVGEKSCGIGSATYQKINPAQVPSKGELLRVVSVRKNAKTEPVYAVKVKNNPVFYANGVLVHNCDALVMLLLRFRSGGFLTLSSDEAEDESYYGHRTAKYY